MPWKTTNTMEQRAQFVSLALSRTISFVQLCKRFGISRPTGYKWLHRAKNEAFFNSIQNRSKKPRYSPSKTQTSIEHTIISLRFRYPYWGARKLKILLKKELPEKAIPSERTINRILARYGMFTCDSPVGVPPQRFEYEKPNDLWQIDFKGEFRYDNGSKYCFPLTLLDDHSRFDLLLDGQPRLSMKASQESLERVFRNRGLPKRLLLDRGALWYATSAKSLPWTQLSVWLMRLNIQLIYGRPYHPQTKGKIERFHKTLKYDLLERRCFHSMKEIQQHFDEFQYEYNYIRPHEGIDMKTPSDRYRNSKIPFPEKLPKIEYSKDGIVINTSSCGTIYYEKRRWFVSEALANQPVYLKERDFEIDVFFMKTKVRTLNLIEKTTY